MADDEMKEVVSASDDSSDSEESAPYQLDLDMDNNPKVPNEWKCERSDAKVGSFAVLEVVYGYVSHKGISVVQVLFKFF